LLRLRFLRGFYFNPTRWHHGWMKGFLAFSVLLFFLFGTPTFAGIADGFAAYEIGDYATALKEWRPIAEQGDVDIQILLGAMHEYGDGVDQDYTAAAKWYMLAAEQGQGLAQYQLGNLYKKGLGVTQDYKAAIKWYTLAAEQGNADAQYNLGSMYSQGQGVTQDYSRAYIWLNITVSRGNEVAVTNLNNVQKLMTPAEISKAQELARECVTKNYKGC